MSPLFHRRSEEEKAADQEATLARREAAARSEERTAASLVQIEEGHIPIAASERLAQFTQSAAGPAAFSSDLEVSEWSALARLAITPITQVMGSSIYHVGWQPTYYNVPTEVRVLSDAYNECRRNALNRLLEEAQLCGADAVVGVKIDQGVHDWAPGALEFIAVGTADARSLGAGGSLRPIGPGVRPALPGRHAPGRHRRPHERPLRTRHHADPDGPELVRRGLRRPRWLVVKPGARRLQPGRL